MLINFVLFSEKLDGLYWVSAICLERFFNMLQPLHDLLQPNASSFTNNMNPVSRRCCVTRSRALYQCLIICYKLL